MTDEHYWPLNAECLTPAIEFILKNNYTEVGLEFASPFLMSKSNRVVLAMRQVLSKESREPVHIRILSDSFCCTGETSAERLCLQCVIHFGSTCSTLVTCTESFSVFHVPPPQIPPSLFDHIVTGLIDVISSTTDVVLVLDKEYATLESSLPQALRERIPDLNIKALVQKENSIKKESDTINAESDLNECFAGWLFDREECNKSLVVYVGDYEDSGIAIAHSIPWSQFAHYSPLGVDFSGDFIIPPSRMRLVMKRSRPIDEIKFADKIGILVASPSFLEIALKIEALIKECGKIPYMISMGSRINEYKLANFPDIEAFVLVACPLTISFVDSRKFQVPVLSACELVYALKE